MTGSRWEYNLELTNRALRLQKSRPEAKRTATGRATWNQRLHEAFDIVVRASGLEAIDDYADLWNLHYIPEPSARLPDFHRARL